MTFFARRLEVSPILRGVGKQVGAFDHEIYPGFLPRERSGPFPHGNTFDPPATHEESR